MFYIYLRLPAVLKLVTSTLIPQMTLSTSGMATLGLLVVAEVAGAAGEAGNRPRESRQGLPGRQVGHEGL